jgi:hypothetical protein
LVVAHGAYFGRKIAEFAAASAKIESAEEAKSFAGQRRALGKIRLVLLRGEVKC